MPSTSEAQRRLFGMVTAYKEGKLKKASPKVREVAGHVNAKAALEFARSVTKPKPEAKKKAAPPEKADRRGIAQSLM